MATKTKNVALRAALLAVMAAMCGASVVRDMSFDKLESEPGQKVNGWKMEWKNQFLNNAPL